MIVVSQQEQRIKISAVGEFSQLQRGLQQLKNDLSSVTGEIDRGARRGGMFDETQLQALSLFKNRFKDTMREVEAEFQKQNTAVDRLHQQMQKASKEQQKNIGDEIRQREKKLDVLRRELRMMEELYSKRENEANSYQVTKSKGGVDAGAINEASNNSWAGTFGKRILAGAGGLAKGGLALAGIGGIGAILSEAYQQAFQREVESLDLAQRLRWSKGFSGSNTNIYDRVSEVGRRDNMGYEAQESWMLQDMFSRRAGALSTSQQYDLQKFGRAYGISVPELSSNVGQASSMGYDPSKFVDEIAGSVAQSGMTARVIEVMEVQNDLLSSMNKTLKDGENSTILGYQTILDRIGTTNNMSRLTGQQGKNVLEGLGGIFSPNNEQWKWMGIRALQDYDPAKYGNMDLYGLERTFEEGLSNKDNLPAMSKYIKSMSGGDESLTKRILQRWLQEGGANMSKKEVDQLWTATNGLTAFDEKTLDSVVGKNQSADSGAKYGERKNEQGQEILDVEARYQKALEGIGSEFLGAVTLLKGGITTAFEELNIGLDKFTDSFDTWFEKFIDNLPETWQDKATGAMELLTEYWQEAMVLGGAVLGMFKGAKWLKELLGDKDKGDKGGKGGSKRNPTLPDLDDDSKPKTGSRSKPKPTTWEKLKNTGTQIKNSKWAKLGVFGEAMALIGAMEAGDKAGDFIFGHSKGQLKPSLNPFSTDKWEDDRAPIWIRMFNKESTENIKNLKEEGSKDLSKLQKEGSSKLTRLDVDGRSSMSSMEKTTKTKMEEVAKEHRGIKDFFKDMFSPMINDFSKIYSNITGSGDSDLVSQIMAGIVENEGSYGSVAKNDGGALSIGKLQWHGNRAKDLLLSIKKTSPSTFNKHLGGTQLAKELENGSSFAGRKLSGSEATSVSNLLKTGVGMSAQDSLAETDVNRYLKVGRELGITDPKALAYFADLYNQNPRSAVRIVKSSNKSLESIHKLALKDSVMGDYSTRRNKAFNYAKDITGGGIGDSSIGFFNGWQNRITSHFGDTHGRDHAHGGLDINGKQGDFVEALASGKISFIKMDDGGKYDEDGKANTRGGGTEVGIQMDDGKTYFYSHMSGVNKDLLNRWFGKKDRNIAVNQGDFIGNIGGDKGKAGSGYSTTGSHLHLGLLDKQGYRLDPEKYLSGFMNGGYGDSDIGMFNNSTPWSSPSNNVSVQHKIDVGVTLTVQGEGAKHLSQVQLLAFEKMARQIFEKAMKEKLQFNPTTMGWN